MKKIYYSLLTIVLCAFSVNAQTVVSSSYNGLLNITMMGSPVADNQEASIQIDYNGDGTCTFTLPNLTLDFGGTTLPLGDITVANATVTTDDNGTDTYSGQVDDMQLLEGAIVADVTINGTITAASAVNFQVNVDWEGTPIAVAFTADEGALAAQTLAYDGYLNIEMGGQAMGDPDMARTVLIATDLATSTCTFTLPELSLMGMSLGDIVVENVTVSDNGTTATYTGQVTDMQLMGGFIVADVTLAGTVEASAFNFDIDVLWNTEDGDIPVDVKFTSEPQSSSVGNIAARQNAVFGTQGTINIQGSEGRVYIYSVTGQLVACPIIGSNAQIAMPQGIYVVKANGKATKVIVK